MRLEILLLNVCKTERQVNKDGTSDGSNCVIGICWFCQNPRFVFEGTEDMVAEYHDYWFHIKESLKGEVIALGVCVVVGLVIQFVL